MGVDGLHLRQEAEVEAQHAVFGMVDDPAQLVGVQARVDRMQNTARAADPVVELQVAVAVPREGADPLAEREPCGIEGVGHLARARRHRAPAGPVDVAFDPARHDFGVAVLPVGEFEQRGDQERLILH